MPTQTPEQAANVANPTPFNISTPANEGLFRVAGDNGDAVYQKSNGKYIGYRLAQTGQPANNYSANIAALSAKGVDFHALPTLNAADLGLQNDGATQWQSLDALPGSAPVLATATKTLNGPEVKADTSAQSAVLPYLPNGSKSTGLYNSPTSIQSTAPGGTATNLYDYYAAQGKPLPAVADRATQYQTLGLGQATDYRGTAQQNEALLSAMQLKDHSTTTIGSGIRSTTSSGGTTAVNTTPAGVALSTALSGSDAASTLANYKTYLASALGVAQTSENTANANLSSFYGSQKSATQILQEELDRRGITQEQSLLSDLDNQINTQTKLLNDLPDNIRTTLQDVGVSQAQLERLQVAEAKKPTELLNDLLTKRGALASDINTAVGWAEKFADTRLADQAAKLSALQWEVSNAQGQYKDLSSQAQQLVLKSIDDQKTIMETAKTAAEHGATSTQIDNILAAKSPGDALIVAGPLMVTPKTTSATTAISADITDAGNALEIGVPAKGYNGRGPDGFVDPNLYIALYNQAFTQYGAAGAAAFIQKHSPAKDLNPANIGRSDLPSAVANALQAQQKKASVSIDSNALLDALTAAGAQ